MGIWEDAKEEAEAKRLAAKNRPDPGRKLDSFEGVTLRAKTISGPGLKDAPLHGAIARVETGADIGRRTTATRVIGGAVLGFGVGAIVGAIAKKKTGTLYLTVETSAGECVVELKPKHEKGARKFIAKVNTQAVNTPPPAVS